MTLVNFIIALVTIVFSSGLSIAVFNAIVNRKGRRANEAQSVADVATSVNEINLTLREEMKGVKDEMRQLKIAVVGLTDAIDDLMPKIFAGEPLTKEEATHLRLVNNTAKSVS